MRWRWSPNGVVSRGQALENGKLLLSAGKAFPSGMNRSDCFELFDHANATLLGLGGGAIVYAATWYGCPVAAKVVPAAGSCSDNNDAAREWLNNELAFLPRLHHDRIVSYRQYIFLRTGGTHVLLMEKLAGGSLQNLCQLAAGRRLPIRAETILGVGLQLCDALTYLHDGGLIHADIKPGNILLSHSPTVSGGALTLPPDAAVKLADFGICLNTRDPRGPVSLGCTPAFLAPECALHDFRGSRAARSSRTTARDMYAVGVVLFQLLIPDRGAAHLSSQRVSLGVTNSDVKRLAPLWPTESKLATDPLYATCRHLSVVVNLVQQLLSEDPAKRPPAPWVQRVLRDVLHRLRAVEGGAVVAGGQASSTSTDGAWWPVNVAAGPCLLTNGEWGMAGLPAASGNRPPALGPPPADPTATAVATDGAAAAAAATAAGPPARHTMGGWAGGGMVAPPAGGRPPPAVGAPLGAPTTSTDSGGWASLLAAAPDGLPVGGWRGGGGAPALCPPPPTPAPVPLPVVMDPTAAAAAAADAAAVAAAIDDAACGGAGWAEPEGVPVTLRCYGPPPPPRLQPPPPPPLPLPPPPPPQPPPLSTRPSVSPPPTESPSAALPRRAHRWRWPLHRGGVAHPQ